jgi:hypothetical protein
MTDGEETFLGIISPAEIEILREAQSYGRTHPLLGLFFGEKHGRERYLLESAARQILETNAKWLNDLKPRLLATDDHSHASSALGEIRAYGSLLQTWADVSPGPKVPYSRVSPEFGVDAGDGTVIVEVHTRQLDGSELQSLADHHREHEEKHREAVRQAQRENRVGNVVTTAVTEIFPTGAPDPAKAGDTSVTNTIQRISAIKAKENQIDPERPFVLWLDLHDPTVWSLPLDLEFFRPLFIESREGMVNSGPFWFALYGTKGIPLLHSRGYDYGSMPMAHDGRFFQTMKSHGGPTRVSAVVYSVPNATMLMENPNPRHSLPPRFRAAMLKLPDFRLDLSIIDWEPNTVAGLINAEHKMIHAAANALKKFDAAG